jgi:ribosomal protein S27AE
MAKIIVVGAVERKVSYCPQCRKKVPDANRLERGIKCPRCGFFSWEEFKKYKSLDGVPIPTVKDLEAANEMTARIKKEKVNESGMAPRPRSGGSTDRGSRANKPSSGKGKSTSGSTSKSKDVDESETTD